MKQSFKLILTVVAGMGLLACNQLTSATQNPPPTPTKTPTTVKSPTPTPEDILAVITLIPSPTVTHSPTPSPVPTQSPTATSTPTTTPSPTAEAAEPTATATPAQPVSTPTTPASPTPAPATVAPTATPANPQASTDVPSPKKGLAAPPSTLNCGDLELLRASWYYNWTANADAGCEGNQAFVPRIWGPTSLPQLPTAVESAKASGWLIGFNEPNLPGAGFITPEDGAKLWKQIENAALPQGIKLVSPAPNPYQPGHAPGDNFGYTWLMVMVRAYQAQNGGALPHFDAIGWHVYNADPQTIKTYLEGRYNDFKDIYPEARLWILEYNGCFVQNEPERVMRELTPWFEEKDWIARYAWYVSRPDANPHSDSPCTLINRSGELRGIGELYKSLY